MNSDVRLEVAGVQFGGWTEISIRRSIEQLAATFSFVSSNGWPGSDGPAPVMPGDAATIYADDEPVAVGFVDAVSPSFGPSHFDIAISGRGKPAQLVDCSVTSSAAEFSSLNIKTLAEVLAAPFGISVSVAPGVDIGGTFAADVQPGESAWEMLERYSRRQAVLFTSDADGNLVITRPGARRAAVPLIQGENLLDGTAINDAAGRFAKYIVRSQSPGLDQFSGSLAAHTEARAFDAGVRLGNRTLILISESAGDESVAKKRAEWEAAVRAARGVRVSVSVAGWRQKPGGPLWAPNETVFIDAPWILPEPQDLLITSVELRLDDRGGEVAVLDLTRADAFTPAPTVAQSGDPLAAFFAKLSAESVVEDGTD